MIKEIEKLNSKIDKLMAEKTKNDAQKEVWQERLMESLKAYRSAYGVDLSGHNLAEIKNKLAKELNKVEKETKEEFDKAQKLVSLIENGDIKGAWAELGVVIEEPVVEEVVEEEEEVIEEPVVKHEETLQSASSVVAELGGVESKVVSDVDDLDDDVFFGSTFNREEPVAEKKEEKVGVSKPFAFEEDDDDDEISFGSLKETPRVSKPSFVLEDDDDEDDLITQPSEESSGFEVEDDDDEDDLFGGFRDVLSGSKFEVK